VFDIPAGRWTSSDVLDRIFGIDAGLDRSIEGSTSLIHPNWLEGISHAFADEVMGARGGFDVEYQIIRRNDGAARWVHGLGRLECDAEDRPLRMIGTVQDITDRKRSEERLREQSELLDQAQDAIVVRDMEHRITYWNHGAERLYGWTAAEVAGRAMPEVICRTPEVFSVAHESALLTGEWTGELQQVCKDGREVSVNSRWTMVRDRSGVPKCVLVINTDITGRKKLERQFLRAQRLESIGLLAGGIAHDLNNVMAPIMLAVDLLKVTATQDDCSLLDTISASTQRAAEMCRGVLSFARGLEGRRVDIEVRHLVREIETIAKETFPKNIQVKTTSSRDLWTVAGDPTQLHQVLLNLCINARDAMPGGGRISIAARNVTFETGDAAKEVGDAGGRYVLVQVNDVGTGIPHAIIDKIFDPFFTTKELGKGTGLGLSTSLTIVKGHGGFVRVSSAPGTGAQFQIYLPALPEDDGARTAGARAELPRGDGEMVLIVDDEAAVREITRQTLEAFGYRVLLASHGVDALALYAKRGAEIAVVVTDLLMPVMDGAATIRALIKLDPAVRIIAVSGSNDSVSEALPQIEAGAIPILSKPYSPETLLQAIRRVIVGERATQSAGA
jgi:PAS domain S-box-containing protein